MKHVRNPSWLRGVALVWSFFVSHEIACGQLVLSGNENKLELSSGDPRIVADAPPDTVTVLDFRGVPPVETHVTNIANSVIGPPSNIAIHPNGRMDLVASSIKLESPAAAQWVADNRISILDLSQHRERW